MPRKRDFTPDDTIFFEPRGPGKQAGVKDIFDAHDLTFLLGPAGTGKTHLAVYLALLEMQRCNTKTRQRVEKIIVTRPIIEVGTKLGALPGLLLEKVHPHMLPVYDIVSKMVGDSAKFIKDHFEIVPLAVMRGRTFENCIAILDEAQNCTVSELTLFLSRLGMEAKMIITGDTDQTDIPKPGLKKWVTALRDLEEVGFVEFTEEDIVRHPLVRKILARRPK